MDWEVKDICYSVVLDDAVTDDDGNLIDDFHKLVYTMPYILGDIQDKEGMIDYGTLAITGSRNKDGHLKLTISAKVLPLF